MNDSSLRSMFVFFAYALPATSVLLIFINLHVITILIQALSILVTSFMYIGEDDEHKKMFYLKTALYVGIIGVFVLLILLNEAAQFTLIFTMIAISLTTFHTREVRKSRGWPPLIE